jgi:LysM repeat protein
VGSQETLAAGTVLLVPEPDRQPPPVQKGEEVVVVSRSVATPAGAKRVFYRVVGGDTLSEIARTFDVNRSALVAWNSVDESARLVPGMALQIFVPKSASPQALCVQEGQAKVLVAGTPPFFDYYEGLKGKKRIIVSVRDGDTLSSIGRRYGMSTGWMERVNRRSRSDKLEAGETLVVYTDRGGQAAPPNVVVAALSEPIEPPVGTPSKTATGESTQAAKPE